MAFLDLRVSTRILRKSPVFTLTAVLTIALGVGASTAIFSVTNAVLLRPLPYKDPDRLVVGGLDLRQRHVNNLPFSNADFIDLREGTHAVFDDLAGVFTGQALVSREDGTPEQIRWAVVTTNFFSLIGAHTVAGRDFNPSDGTPQPPAPPPGTAPEAAPARLPAMAILSHEYFQKRYGGNADILGHTMPTTGGAGLLIVGVLAPGVHLYFSPETNIEGSPDVWIANRLVYDASNRLTFSIRPVGRLKEGATLERAQLAGDQVSTETQNKFLIARTSGFHIQFYAMRQHFVAQVRPAILTLMGSVIFLLLIACANVANLLLVRAGLRQRELALRAALGAAPWDLARPVLVEAFLLSSMGSLLGLILAWVGIHELRVLAPANLPRLDNIRIDGFVLGFTAFAGLLAAILFGMVPALRASRPHLMSVLRITRSSGAPVGGLFRNLVVIIQVALSFVLLIGSGLMLRSFVQLQHIDPGFDPHHLLTFRVLGVPVVAKTPEQRDTMVRQIKERLDAMPGIESVTSSFPFPLTGDFNPIRWGTEEAIADSSKFQEADFQLVLPGYFETMGTRLLAGRTFTGDDNLPGRNHVIIDEFLASKAFPKESAIGKRILVRVRKTEPEWLEVIGVVVHQRTSSLADAGREQVYFTDGLFGPGVVRSWALRTNNDVSSYGNEVRTLIKTIDPRLLVTQMERADELVYDAQAATRFSLLLISVFAVIAGALAGVGLYGVLSTAVRQRTSEIGVRIALGSSPGRIFKLVIRQGLGLSTVGIVAGLITAILLTRAMRAMLVGISPTDSLTFTAMTVVFFAISATASWLPARRAARLDPTTALREE